MTDETKRKYLKIISVYDQLILESGKYAPFLGPKYFVENTVHECCHRKITDVSRITVYRALKCKKELIKAEPFL